MSFLHGLFGEKQDPLIERAENLVQAAHVNAIAMFTPLLDRFSVMLEANVEHWDFVLTVASVFMAATRLNNLRLGEAYEEGLMEIVAERLDQWNPDGIRGFKDCKALFESEFDGLTEAGHKTRFVASDAVGKWIVWNVLGRAPQSDEEYMLARETGTMVTHSFFTWWDKGNEE